MTNLEKVTEVSNEELASTLLYFIDSEEDAYRNEFSERALNGTIESPLYLLLMAHKNLSQKSKIVFSEIAKEALLKKDIYEKVPKCPDFYGNTTSLSGIQNIDSSVATLCILITIAYRKDKASVVDEDTWLQVVNDVKLPNTKFKEGIIEKYHTAFRKIALVLDLANSSRFYSQNIRIRRGLSSDQNVIDADSITTPDPEYHEWLKLFKEYLEEQVIKSTKAHYNNFSHFYEYLQKQEDGSNPYRFLSKKPTNNYFNYLKEKGLSSGVQKSSASLAYRFTLWIIDNLMTDQEDGESVSIGYPIFSVREFERISNQKTNSYNPIETNKHAMPTSWLIMCREILSENDFAWPKSLKSEYFNYRCPTTGTTEKVWVPVNTYVYLTMLELPIRKIQVISTDSGEGDPEKYDLQNKQWIPNTNLHANQWQYKACTVHSRGILKKLHSKGKEIVGFYINTNKTADRDKNYSETSGYTIPWNNEVLIKYFSELREWQEKYNPVDGPKAYREIPKTVFETKPTESVLDSIPDRFYLFRTPLSSKGLYPDCPPTNNQLMRFWWELMAELERRLIDLGEDVKIIEVWNESTEQPERAMFTPHGLRVTGLTALSEAGVPIEVLSKIVAGHATILMTLHYIKMDVGHITEVLNDAQKTIENDTQKNMQRWLKNASWEQAKEYTAYNELDGLSAMYNGGAPSTLWGDVNYGLCPFAGTRCNDGGPLAKKEGKNRKSKYDPVPGGAKNCIRCRHFVTGTPWMIPLWLHGNKLLMDSQKLGVTVDEIREQLDELCSQRYQYVKEGRQNEIPSSLSNEIKKTESLLEAKSEALDTTLRNAHAAYNLLEKVKLIAKLKEEGESDRIPVLAVEDSEIDDFKEVSKFRGLDTIVQASRIYSHVQDKDMEAERDHFIDEIMFRNNMTPISFSPLTEDEKRIAADAAARFLTTTLNDQEIMNLKNGSQTLESLGLEASLADTVNRIESRNEHVGLTLKPNVSLLESCDE